MLQATFAASYFQKPVLTSQHGVTSSNTWTFSTTTVRNSNVLRFQYFSVTDCPVPYSTHSTLHLLITAENTMHSKDALAPR